MAASPPTTPKSRPFVGRVLRSNTRSRRTDEKDDPKITGFFNVRKRVAMVTEEKGENLKKRRGVIITAGEAQSPLEPYPSDSPIACSISHLPVDLAPSPPKRPRQLTGFGVFDDLPPLERFDFLATVPVSFFYKLSLTSHTWAEAITTYVKSESWRRRFISTANKFNEADSSQEDVFAATGRLFKALSVSKLTTTRVEFLIRFIESVHDEVKCDNWYRLFYSFTSRWAPYEMQKLASAVRHMNGDRIQKLVKQVLTKPLGTQPDVEMELRRLLLGYFVRPLFQDDRCAKKNAAFWLSCILRSTDKDRTDLQSRICLILFAPTIEEGGVEKIGWNQLVDQVVTSAESAEKRFGDLGSAVATLLLLDHPGSPHIWKPDEVFNLLEEITTCPDPWSFDNFVALLMQRSSLLPVAVTMRMQHGHNAEAGQIVNTMKTLMYRWGIDVEAAMGPIIRNIMTNLRTAGQRLGLVEAIGRAHEAQYREFLYMGNLGRRGQEEEFFAQQAFSTVFNEALDMAR